VVNEAALAEAHASLSDADVEGQLIDHSINWSLYVEDPFSNTVVPYCERRLASLSVSILRAHVSS